MTWAIFETQSSLRRLSFHNSTGSYFQQHISPALCQPHWQPKEIYYKLIYAVQRSGSSQIFLGCQHSAHSRIYALTRVQVHYTRYCICIRSKKLLLCNLQTAWYKVTGWGFLIFCLQNLNNFLNAGELTKKPHTWILEVLSLFSWKYSFVNIHVTNIPHECKHSVVMFFLHLNLTVH